MAASAGARKWNKGHNQRLLAQVFGNGVILRNLEDMLHYSDLKTCRQVSKAFNGYVLDLTGFVSRSTVNVSEASIGSKVFEKFGFKPKHAKVTAFASPFCPQPKYVTRKKQIHFTSSNADVFFDKLSDLESLIYKIQLYTSGTVFPGIYETLKCITKLKDLTICTSEMQLLGKEEKTEGVKEILEEKLSHLESLEVIYGMGDVQLLPSASFKKLNNLKRIAIKTKGGSSLDKADAVSDIRSLLDANQASLVELEVWKSRIWSNKKGVTRLTKIIFPNLRSVSFQVSRRGGQPVGKFLQNHRQQLQKVKLKVFELRQPLLEILMGLSSSLQVLILHIKGDITDIQERAISLDRFVNLKKLEFRRTVKRVFGAPAPFPILVDRIPTGLKKLKFSRVDETATFCQTAPNMESFINVTSLTLRDSLYSISDESLWNVFHYMINIKDLRISGTRTSDEAFMGALPTPGGIERVVDESRSIYNLRALQNLELIACRISDKTIVGCVKFPDLRGLNISKNSRVTAASFYAALEQNPALETLKMDAVVKAPLKTLKALLINKYPRLSRCNLQDLRVNKARYRLDTMDSYTSTDSELDGSGYDSLESDYEEDELAVMGYYGYFNNFVRARYMIHYYESDSEYSE